MYGVQTKKSISVLTLSVYNRYYQDYLNRLNKAHRADVLNDYIHCENKYRTGCVNTAVEPLYQGIVRISVDRGWRNSYMCCGACA